MRFPRAGVGVFFVVLLAALTWWSVSAVNPPAAGPADAPAEQFSADRAHEHVQAISTQVHPAGSPAAAEVRDYIVTTLTGMGLDPRVEESVGATGNLGGYAMANVENVVATLPGSASTGTVYLMAHYDSVQVSYGANDDGAGTATLLETARALMAAPQLRNDVVLLFTDAEEACLCGAEAYVHDNPDATGVVLNFEARGTSGPAIMFETSVGNAGVVGVYADAVPYPVATSFAVEVYRILPNDTDFSPFRDAGRFTGLNTAYIDGSAAYHSPQDSIENFSSSTLQHHGGNALAMALAFGAEDLATLATPSSGDATYFPVLGTLFSYPGWLVWPLAVLALASVLGAMWLLVRRGECGYGQLVGAAALGFVPILLPAAAAFGFWQLLVLIRPGYGQLADPWQPGWYRIAVVALVVTVVLTWYALLRRRLGAEPLFLGALLWIAVLGALLAFVAPGGSYLAAIPALAGGLAAMLRISSRVHMVRALSGLLAGAVAIIVLAPTVMLFFPALGLQMAAAPALFATLGVLVLLPVLDLLLPDADTAGSRLFGALPALVTVTITVIAVGVGLIVDRFDTRHPVPVEMMYAMDATAGDAFWVRPGGDPTGWSDTMVTAEQDLSDRFPLLPASATVGDAPAAPLKAPEVTVVSDVATATGRQVQVLITPQRQSRLVYVDLPDGNVTAATAQGRAVALPGDGRLDLLFHAVPSDGLTLTLDLTGAGPTRLRVMDGSDDLSNLPGFVLRPDGVGVEGSHTSEMVLVAADAWI